MKALSPDAAGARKTGEKEVVPKAKPNRPTTAKMVTSAIESLAERKGSSIQAIKKYMDENYEVDTEKLAPFIKKYLKSAVESETIIQTSGKGATGSFKLAKAAGKVKSKPKVSGSPKKVEKPRAAKKAENDAKPKKMASPKKATKPAGQKLDKPKVVRSRSASPSKVKKTSKGPAAKSTAPKAKTSSASPKKAPKK